MYHECLVPGCRKTIFLDLVEVELHITHEHNTITTKQYVKNKMDKAIRKLDLYRRIPKDLTENSLIGAVISIAFMVL